jgi:Acetyltransferase (GNAT) family
MIPMIENVIYEDQNLKIVLEFSPNSAAINLLKKVIYGTNGPRYINTGQEEKLANIKNPYFFRLIKNGETIGFCCLCKRLIDSKSSPYVAFYGRYFVIEPALQGQKYGGFLTKQMEEYLLKTEEKPLVFYAYIEENNLKSLNVTKQLQIVPFATMKTRIFTRIFPKLNPQIERLSEEDKKPFLDKLATYFTKHSFRNLENINYQNNYFVIKHQGEIVAGLQANPQRWQIVKMNGLSGKILLNILPHIPIFRKIFNPKNYEFLAIEGVYIKQGFQDQLYPLIEGLLCQFSIHSALFQLDSNDPLIDFFKKNGKLGILNALKKDINTYVTVRAKGIVEDDFKEDFVYVSSFDFT